MRGFSSLAKGVRLLVTHVGGASGAFGKLGAVLGGLSGPVMAVVAVIGTLVAAFLNLWTTNEEFRTAITGIWNNIVSKVKAFCDQLTQRINALGFDFKDITQVLQSIWNGFCQVLAPLFEGAFQNISTILGVVLDSLIGLLDVFSNIFSGNWRGAWESAKGIFSGIWQGIRSILSVTLTTLRNTLDPHMSSSFSFVLNGTEYKAGALFDEERRDSYIEKKYEDRIQQIRADLAGRDSRHMYLASGSITIDQNAGTIQASSKCLGVPDTAQFIWITASDPVEMAFNTAGSYGMPMRILAYDAGTQTIKCRSS